MRHLSTLLGAVFGLSLLAGPVQAAVYQVNTTDDHLDGTCNSDCSLRDAISIANSDYFADTIQLPAGLYVLDNSGNGEDDNENGDLDITDNGNLTIVGAGAGLTTINGYGDDRIFHVLPDSHASLTLRGLTLTAGELESGEGGAIAFYSNGLLQIDACDIVGNHAPSAGAIMAIRSQVRIEDSDISFNSSDDGGGGVFFLDSDVYFARSNFANNTTQNGAAFDVGANSSSSSALLEDSTFVANTFVGLGFGEFHLQNVTITGGFGGLGLSYGTASLSNVTVVGNSVNDIQLISLEVNIANSILGTADCFSTDLVSLGYNLVGDVGNCDWTAAAGDQFGVDPLLAALGDNGGPTHTMLPQAGSPVIDGGNPEGCLGFDGEPLLTDQRGTARPQGERCDIGAVEVVAGEAPQPTPSVSPEPSESPSATDSPDPGDDDDDDDDLEGDGGCSLNSRGPANHGLAAGLGLLLGAASLTRAYAKRRK